MAVRWQGRGGVVGDPKRLPGLLLGLHDWEGMVADGGHSSAAAAPNQRLLSLVRICEASVQYRVGGIEAEIGNGCTTCKADCVEQPFRE